MPRGAIAFQSKEASRQCEDAALVLAVEKEDERFIGTEQSLRDGKCSGLGLDNSG